MSDLMRLDKEYREWVISLSNRYKNSQIKASIKVNNEMLMLYWSIGKDISQRHAESKWGNKLFAKLSMDMTDLLPNIKGFSPTNLRYMMRFYEIYNDDSIVPQLVEQNGENQSNQIVPQVGEQ